MVAFLARALTTELWKCEVVWNLNSGGGLRISLGAALMHNTPVLKSEASGVGWKRLKEEEVKEWTYRELQNDAFGLESSTQDSQEYSYILWVLGIWDTVYTRTGQYNRNS